MKNQTFLVSAGASGLGTAAAYSIGGRASHVAAFDVAGRPLLSANSTLGSDSCNVKNGFKIIDKR